jgi:hypothetical protein
MDPWRLLVQSARMVRERVVRATVMMRFEVFRNYVSKLTRNIEVLPQPLVMARDSRQASTVRSTARLCHS